MAVNTRSGAPWARNPQLRMGAAVAVALAVGFVVWLLVRGGDSSSSPPAPVTPIAATAASQERLAELSKELDRPIYWLGPLRNRTYELQRTSKDRVFVRYLPDGNPVGTSKRFALVGTYPVQDAVDVLKALAKKPGERSFTAPNGGFAVYSTSLPTNVYLAFPGQDVQIEVYAPSPDGAQALVSRGKVVPVSS
jgi:hypothetical protein